MIFQKTFFYNALFFCTFLGSCQHTKDHDLVFIKNLSKANQEISGITTFPNQELIYAINDSGNKNTLYQLDYQGEIKKRIPVPEAKNIDWEDLAYDENNNIYIGDFGNNNNDRKNLAIYKLSNIGSEKVTTTKIKFSLEDQDKFPPGKKHRNFDIEAFIYKNGYFYLFTKNRSSKFNGETKLYKLKNEAGRQRAKLISRYKVCNDPSDCFISSAAINAKGDKIALLTYNKVLMLSGFKGDNLFNGTIKTIKLHHSSQKESICFKNNTTLFIADEASKKTASTLYEYAIEE